MGILIAKVTIIASCFALLAHGQAQTATQAPRQTHEAQTDHIHRAVHLLTANEPEFDKTLRDQFPELAGSASFQTIKPLTAVLVNKSKLAVRAYSVRWIVVDSKGDKHRLKRDVLVPLGRHSSISAKTAVMRPGEKRIVSPMFEWSLTRSRYHPHGNAVEPIMKLVSKKAIYSDLSDVRSVTAVLDCVIFDDGTSAGPDESRLAYRLGKERDAEHDEGVSMVRLLKSGASDDKIRSVLTYHAGWDGPQKDEASAFRAVRGREAKLLLAYFSTNGRDALAKKVQQLQHMNRTQVQSKVW